MAGVNATIKQKAPRSRRTTKAEERRRLVDAIMGKYAWVPYTEPLGDNAMTTATKTKKQESSKSFIVTSEGHRFRFMPEDVGYSVSEIGVRGVNTQGDTFEEALANAQDASRGMAEFREEMKAEAATHARRRPAAVMKRS